MGIKCCKDCVPPKRYPGCHSTCSEYLSEKKEYEEQKQALSLKRQAEQNLYEQRSRQVYKALRGKRGRR